MIPGDAVYYSFTMNQCVGHFYFTIWHICLLNPPNVNFDEGIWLGGGLELIVAVSVIIFIVCKFCKNKQFS